jgi:arylformamidase
MDDARVTGGLVISGIYDLEPIRLSYLNDKLKLDPAEARRNSPILHLPAAASPLVVAVGLGELPELIRQSEDYRAHWRERGLPGQYLPLPDHDHFSVLEELARPSGRLLAALREMACAASPRLASSFSRPAPIAGRNGCRPRPARA